MDERVSHTHTQKKKKWGRKFWLKYDPYCKKRCTLESKIDFEECKHNTVNNFNSIMKIQWNDSKFMEEKSKIPFLVITLCL